jgi:hypothetical protein
MLLLDMLVGNGCQAEQSAGVVKKTVLAQNRRKSRVLDASAGIRGIRGIQGPDGPWAAEIQSEHLLVRAGWTQEAASVPRDARLLPADPHLAANGNRRCRFYGWSQPYL